MKADTAVTLQDNSAVGVKATIAKLNAMLQRHDQELWAHLEQKNKVLQQCSLYKHCHVLVFQ